VQKFTAESGKQKLVLRPKQEQLLHLLAITKGSRRSESGCLGRVQTRRAGFAAAIDQSRLGQTHRDEEIRAIHSDLIFKGNPKNYLTEIQLPFRMTRILTANAETRRKILNLRP